ncbi:MarR family winged helix-turn-helix transcriptional regulator [Streptomyces scopuliridis]|uniref:MarR family transcriptional regulator n=1 Tax=Streptomyces scopuliridis RB72 TaxID=1440053 RepID=A0A2T7T5W6_9ACTN|nr:MarR family winged helix-turn-helix transcriptional regulator [Streptomyces scopuliridis]PVE10550.1 MarR family transcriptional regulator [Streptomyces scopuliridis RB72]
MTSDPPATSDTPACPDRLPAAARGGPLSHAISRVARLHRIAAGKLLRRTGLYPGQEFLMMHLWDADAVRQSELIKSMDLDPSTVTKMLQRLDHAGYVRRSADPRDRRAVLVTATGDSCTLRSEVEGAWTELEEHTLAGLDDTERAELARLLAKVEANLCTEAANCPERPSVHPAGRSGGGQRDQ